MPHPSLATNRATQNRSRRLLPLFSGVLLVAVLAGALVFSKTARSGAHAQAAANPTQATRTSKLLIPSYFSPASNTSQSWATMCNDAPAQSIVILNPASGPGTVSNSTFVRAVKYCQSKNISVVGYVYTDYGKRSTRAAEADITDYYSWYRVDGIFLDQMAPDPATLSYYRTLHSSIRSRGGSLHDLEVGNMGTVPGTDWALRNGVVTILALFEGGPTNLHSFTMPAWASSYPANDFAAVVYNVSSSMSSICSTLSKTDHISYRYVTDSVYLKSTDNPYSALPSYWTKEARFC